MPTATMPFSKVRSANATDSSFPSRIPTTTEPTGAGVIDVAKGDAAGMVPYDQVILVPYGTGNDDGAFDMRVIGWRPVGTLWIPVPLLQLACVLCTAVGIAGATTGLIATERLCDTLTISIANSNIDASVFSPTGNIVASAMFDNKGYPKFEFTFDLGTNATAANCLYCMV